MSPADWIALIGIGGPAILLAARAVAKLTRIADAVDNIPRAIAEAVDLHVLRMHPGQNGRSEPPAPDRHGSSWRPRG